MLIFLFSSFENPAGLCRDFRLKENPDIQMVSANAAGDSNSNTSSLPSVTGNHGDVDTNNTGEFDISSSLCIIHHKCGEIKCIL